MELGQKLGEGGGSEAYTWGDSEVVKLVKQPFDPRIVDWEVKVTRAAFAAGAPAPEVRDVVEVNGRPGIVFPRYDGKTLLAMMLAGEVTPARVGAIMAELAYSIHAPGYQFSLLTFRAWARISVRELRRRGMPHDVLDIAERAIGMLPESGVLCHGDLHPDNILITANGPVAIDWISALSANPLVDVARQHLTFTLFFTGQPSSRGMVEIVPGVTVSAASLTAPRCEVDETFIETYARLSNTTAPALLSAVDPYLVVMATMRMLESSSSADERQALAEYIRSNHRPG